METLLSRRLRWLFPLLAILILMPLSHWVDIPLSSYFYTPENKQFTNNAFLKFVYDYAQLPALMTGIFAGFAWIFSYFSKTLEKNRRYFAFLCLALALGPGLLVNGVFKAQWGRPRPRHIEELGGTAQFRPFYLPNTESWTRDLYKSMPSGHASMGFYFLSFVIIGYRTKRRFFHWLGLLLTLALSFCLGWARIAQGGHFFTDVLMAGVIVWSLLLLLDSLLLYDTQTA